MIDEDLTVEERLVAAEERIRALEQDRWDKAEFETRKHDFIRNAATQLFIHGRKTEDGYVTMSSYAAWEHARLLWSNKPEDC